MESPAITDNSELAVLNALVSFADSDTGESFPGIQRIAEVARLTVRSVENAMIRLLKNGHISILRQGGGRSKTTVYQVHIR